METELTSLCQSVLEDFNLVLFYLPPPPGGALHPPSEEEEEEPPPPQQHADSSSPVLPDTLVFKMVVTCLMVVHSLKKGGQCRWAVAYFDNFSSKIISNSRITPTEWRGNMNVSVGRPFIVPRGEI